MKSNQKSSQSNRFSRTGHTPGPVDWQAFTRFFRMLTRAQCPMRALAVSRIASGRKQVKQWWLCAQAGLSGMLPEAVASSDNWGQQAPAQVLPALQGNGPERRRSIRADLIFGSFHQGKEQSLPAAIERADAHSVYTDSSMQAAK